MYSNEVKGGSAKARPAPAELYGRSGFAPPQLSDNPTHLHLSNQELGPTNGVRRNMNYFPHKIIRFFIRIIAQIIPLGNYVVFESCPDYSDNSKSVFDEMKKRKSLEKYKMIWLCVNPPTIKSSKNTLFVQRKSIRGLYYRIRAKALLCCNRFVEPYRSKQFAINLSHGTPIKAIGSYRIPTSIRYSLAASPKTAEILMELFSLEKDQVIPLGLPRNDDISKYKVDLRQVFKADFDKVVIWLPTFRQHRSGSKTGSNHAIPLLWDNKNIKTINDTCSRLHILLVIKPHYAQDVSFITELNTSNILIIDDDFIKNNNMTLNSFLGGTDALLTDYSSVYFDYTLCNKPIGLIWEDIEQYKNNPGFSIDLDYAMKGGQKIYTIDDLLNFFIMLSKNEDFLLKERCEVRDVFNISTDGQNSKRAVDFIIKAAHL